MMNTDAASIESWLVGRVVAYGKVDAGSFTPETPLAELGLDSVYALTLCGDIEDEYGLDVDPTIVWDHPTIGQLAGGISERLAAAA
ncbi:acyl carrier protein [Agromyces sp. NPDC058484]|uniref:acyl carrier protein n=1 Tax=Agromyces sp. NPDC058484 TaxID=3346524 RepID=UPI00365035BA